MITIDEIHTELVVEGTGEPRSRGPVEERLETRMDDLREVVRALLREELERYQRTEARR
jgi:hypothetical protein